MKNNTAPVSESPVPLSLKLTLMGGGILVMVMFVLTVRSIIGILRPASSSSAALQTKAETVVVRPKPPGEIPRSSPPDNFGAQRSPNLSPPETPPLSVPDNAPPALSSSSRPTTFGGPNEIAEQRKQARIATLAARQRELEYAPIEIREQREKQRQAIIEAAKQELLKQAGTSGVPREVLQKLEQSDPILY